MRQILYYLPKPAGEGITAAAVRDLGITWLLDEGREPCVVPCYGGPDGGTGVVFARETGNHPHCIGYYKDRQTWEKAPGAAYWVGYFNDAKPGPKDLERAYPGEKHKVRLRDGNEWVIPPVILESGALNVPFGLRWNDDGEFTGKPVPEYRQLVDGAWYLFEVRQGEMSGEPVMDVFRRAVEIVAMDMGRYYRIGFAEAQLLALFDTENIGGATLAITDFPSYLDVKKKAGAASEESSIASG